MNRMYVVCPTFNGGVEYKQTQTQFGGILQLKHAESDPNLAFFVDIVSAMEYAKRQAAVNGGKELSVCECQLQFFSKPSEIRQKVWKGEELIPQ